MCARVCACVCYRKEKVRDAIEPNKTVENHTPKESERERREREEQRREKRERERRKRKRERGEWVFN